MTTLPHTSEDFYNSAWLPSGESASSFWVGPAPRLSTLDDDTSFARVEVTDPELVLPAARLAPFTISGAVTVTGRVRFTGPWPDGAVFSLGLVDPAVGFGAFGTTWGAGLFGAELGVWHTMLWEITAGAAATLATAAAAGELVVFGTGGVTRGTDGYDVTYLEAATAGGVIPLRQFHRDDGLGVTPPRAYGGASRNRTQRAYGYA